MTQHPKQHLDWFSHSCYTDRLTHTHTETVIVRHLYQYATSVHCMQAMLGNKQKVLEMGCNFHYANGLMKARNL